eukprot:8777087-Alexandrium_andersonii.AAC.1
MCLRGKGAAVRLGHSGPRASQALFDLFTPCLSARPKLLATVLHARVGAATVFSRSGHRPDLAPHF